ncbi:MAG: tRNA-dihydrouridine synthase family protein [Verrucomicrobiota bacterium]
MTLTLAPMQDVTNLAFWRVLERRGGPDVYVTEYFRVHRQSHPEAFILRSVDEFETAKPVIAQMIGNDPQHLVRTALLLQEHPISGIELNLGCPAPVVCGKDCGGALLRDPERIERLVEALRPVVQGTLTLKTRLGYQSEKEFPALLKCFEKLPIDGLAIHGRTVKEKYQSPVHTDCLAEAVRSLPYPVQANGSIVSLKTAQAMQAKTRAHGLMLGRGAIRNPWLFDQIRGKVSSPTLRDLRDYILELSEEVRATHQYRKANGHVQRMKKFLNYIAVGIHDGIFLDAVRRATTEREFHAHCQEYLSSDQPLDPEPPEGGRVFCGHPELLTHVASAS